MITKVETVEDLRQACIEYKDLGYIPMNPDAFAGYQRIVIPPVHCACENCWDKKVVHSFMGLRIKVVDSL